jgi:hypothetical protein
MLPELEGLGLGSDPRGSQYTYTRPGNRSWRLNTGSDWVLCFSLSLRQWNSLFSRDSGVCGYYALCCLTSLLLELLWATMSYPVPLLNHLFWLLPTKTWGMVNTLWAMCSLFLPPENPSLKQEFLSQDGSLLQPSKIRGVTECLSSPRLAFCTRIVALSPNSWTGFKARGRYETIWQLELSVCCQGY